MLLHGRSPESDLGWEGHLLLVYGADLERDRRLASWVRAGLTHEEKVIYVDAEHLSTPDSLLSRLLVQGVDAHDAIASGQLEVVPSPQLRDSNAAVDLAAAALADGYRAVRLSAETTSVRSVVSNDCYIELENTLDTLCFSHPVSVLCTYDARQPPPSLDEVTTLHFDGVRESSLETSSSEGCLVVSGEVDHFNAPVLMLAIAAAAQTATETLQIDVSGVTFLGVAGARSLVDATEELRGSGRTLVLHEPSEEISRTIDRLGLAQLPGVVIKGSR